MFQRRKRVSQKRIETTMSYWVYLPQAPNRAEADRRAAELRSRGITEVLVIDSGPPRA